MYSPCSVFHPYCSLRSFGSYACDTFCPNYKSSLCHVCSRNLNIDSTLSCTLYLCYDPSRRASVSARGTPEPLRRILPLPHIRDARTTGPVTRPLTARAYLVRTSPTLGGSVPLFVLVWRHI